MKKTLLNSWVEVEEVLLEPAQRAPQVSEDTQNTPLKQWIKGYLLTDNAEKGDMVEIQTMSSRRVKGKLCDTNPEYIHSFGQPVKELLEVGRELKEELKNL